MKAKKSLCIDFGLSEKKLWCIKFTPYTDCLFPTSPLNSTIVWPRLKNSSEDDPSVLFVGYSNLQTEYGDEGTKIFCDTAKCSRTAFFSGDELEYSPDDTEFHPNQDFFDENSSVGKYTKDWMPKTRVNQYKYNHLYGDFRNLRNDFPYLIDSNFFEYIFVGDRTFIYFSTIYIITDFCSMLKKNGSLIIALNENILIHYYGPFLDNYLGHDYDFIPYFYTTPVQNEKFLAHMFRNNRSILSDFKYNSIDNLKNELSDKIPFLSNFLDQNKTDNSVLHKGKESCILKITKI